MKLKVAFNVLVIPLLRQWGWFVLSYEDASLYVQLGLRRMGSNKGWKRLNMPWRK